jgi:hydroxyacylglutathione hydrolase
MMDVLHVPAFQDNYIWLIRLDNAVAIVDPGDAEPVIAAIEAQHWNPMAVLCTHHHADHVGGAAELAGRYEIPVFGPARERIPAVTHPLDEGNRVELPGLQFDVFATPGHTLGHIMYYGHGLLFCGDTLFSAGCGRLFEGTPAQMHASLSRVAALPGDTKVFCGHEYTSANLRFASTVEPDNGDIRRHTGETGRQRSAGLPTLPSTIATERLINPFLRCDVDTVRQAAQTHDGRTLASAVEVFASIRRWKDEFRE